MPLHVDLPHGGRIQFEITEEYRERGWIAFEASVERTLDAFRERKNFRRDDAIIQSDRVTRHLGTVEDGRPLPAVALRMLTKKTTSLDFEDYTEVFAAVVDLDAPLFLACCPADQFEAIRERIGTR